MQDYGYPGLSPYAATFERLQRARLLLLWIRMAIWVWCAAMFTWAVPLGAWSAYEQPHWAALTTGCVLAAGGAALALVHRRIGRIGPIYVTADQARAAVIEQPDGV